MIRNEWRRLLHKKTGAGGVKCYCCNWTKALDGKNRKRLRVKLNKLVRKFTKKIIFDD